MYLLLLDSNVSGTGLGNPDPYRSQGTLEALQPHAKRTGCPTSGSVEDLRENVQGKMSGHIVGALAPAPARSTSFTCDETCGFTAVRNTIPTMGGECSLKVNIPVRTNSRTTGMLHARVDQIVTLPLERSVSVRPKQEAQPSHS